LRHAEAVMRHRRPFLIILASAWNFARVEANLPQITGPVDLRAATILACDLDGNLTGDAAGENLRTSSYGVNLLNQYTNCTVPGYMFTVNM
jgi:hypothetical protein